MSRLSSESLASHERAVAQYQEHVGEVAQYLEDRGIAGSAVDTYRLGYVPKDETLAVSEHDEYRGRLAIPYLTQAGVVQIKFRSMDGSKPKYTGLPGTNRLYNVQALFDADDTIAVCEGELDALLLSVSGCPAVGVAGATNLPKHYRYIFADFTRVVVFRDGDDAGKKMGNTWREAMGAIPVKLPDGMDVTDMIVGGQLEWLMSRL